MKCKEVKKEYNFSNGKRGKYARQYAAGTNLVALAPDVAKVFTSAKTVNEALRMLAKFVQAKKRRAA